MAKLARGRRLGVCLLSPHPLALEEFKGLLPDPEYATRVLRLELHSPMEWHNVRVPKVPVYIVDAPALSPAVHGLVGGILHRLPSVCVVVVAEEFDEANAFAFLRGGVKGLLTYAEAVQHLSRALRAVASGGLWVPRRVLSHFVDFVLRNRYPRARGVAAHLSNREKEVLNDLLDNRANKEIASKLHIAERTVKFHVTNLLAKYGVRRRADLILLFAQGGLSS